MQSYAAEIEVAMQHFYDSLNEKDRRRYAGIEALKLGLGGRNYIARILNCSRRTVTRGAKEVSGLSSKETEARIREMGGGRKPYTRHWENIDEKFLEVLREHTAGDPMDATVRWTDLTPKELMIALREDEGIEVSQWVVRQLLKKHNYRRRKAQKKCSLNQDIPNRDAQFENIARLTAEYQAAGNPILSMDTKKKEHLGNFYREGHLYTLSPLLVNDHDFISSATGIIIPHSLYDETLNIGYIQIGTSHDTGELACDSLRYWWHTYGQQRYPKATSLLIKCDGGGSNDARH